MNNITPHLNANMQRLQEIRLIKNEIEYIYRVKLSLTITNDLMETINKLVALEKRLTELQIN